MRVKIWITGLALAAGLGTAGAQDIFQEGRVINAPYFDAGRRLLLSQHDYIYGTARTAAMGGAFTSLGADLSSMNINPAGLGMYQSSDWGFTQALSIDGMRTSSQYMRPGAIAAGGSRVSYGLNNIGAAYNVLNSSGTLTSLTIGFNYNRAANFNSRTNIETFGDDSTIGQMFERQLNLMFDEGVPENALRPGARPWENEDIRFHEWGAVLGYQTDVVGMMDNGYYGYYTNAIPSDSYFSSVTKGGIYEYNFSIGANISNRLYLGATLGATDIHFSEDITYEELYASGATPLGRMWFDQSTNIRGAGITAKFGLVARPVESLRIGVAFHLPTFYSLEKSYWGEMGTDRGRADTGLPLMDDELRFNTAPRLLAGISGVIADRAIIALDWEVAWYNKIRMRSDFQREIDDSKSESERLYKPAHTLRAGLEYLITDAVSLRAGGSYMMDFMKDDFVTDNPTARSGFSITTGLGFNIGSNGYLDVAYVYNRTRMTDYSMYYFDDGADVTSQWNIVNGNRHPRTYVPTRNHHMITLTLGNRF